MLLYDVRARREAGKLGTRRARAGFAMGKTRETFNFHRVSEQNRAYTHDLSAGPRSAACCWSVEHIPSGAGSGPLRGPAGAFSSLIV